MQFALAVVGALCLAFAAVCALGAAHAYVTLDIRAVLDDLSGRARQRGVADAELGGSVDARLPFRGGVAAWRDNEDVVATRLGAGVADANNAGATGGDGLEAAGGDAGVADVAGGSAADGGPLTVLGGGHPLTHTLDAIDESAHTMLVAHAERRCESAETAMR